MEAVDSKSRCATCEKVNSILKCGGCSQDFCYNHFGVHRQQLNSQLEEVEINRDLFRQTLSEQTSNSQKQTLLQQVDKWERDSINQIQQIAEEARQIIFQHTDGHIQQVEVKLNKLTNELRQGREENNFVETDLRGWTEQLTQLTDELNKLSNISLRHDSKPFVNKLYVDIATASLSVSKLDGNMTWIQNGITVAGGNGRGNGLNQLSMPLSVYVDKDETIYIADYNNDRIVEWKNDGKTGRIIAGGNGKGDRSNQLNGPTDVVFDEKTNSLIICDKGNRRVVQWFRQNITSGQTIISNIDCIHLTIDNDGYLYVSDHQKHEVRRWKIGDTSGTVVAGGNGCGDHFNQLNGPTSIFVDKDNSVYVTDWCNHRVMKWVKDASEGIVVAGGQGDGNNARQLSLPQGVVVDQLGTVYIADFGNNRIIRWCNGATQGSIVVGGNGKGNKPNQLISPQGLSIDHQGNLYVVDQWNHRIQKFNFDLTSN